MIVAIGARRAAAPREARPGVVFAGDADNGPTTVVEAVAAGKNAALEVLAWIAGHRAQGLGHGTEPAPDSEPTVVADHDPRSTTTLLRGPGSRASRSCPASGASRCRSRPTSSGGRSLSPFLLSAAPPTDGYEQMRKAYEAGWAGGVMKTAFDGVPIHIPSRYMFAFDQTTYGNCDNVSGHPLDRVCREVERLRREFPDRLTLASTGGPVTGHDELDRHGWQANTRKLEGAGALGIEYSLSCPQGGDGTKGDIVSQDAELTAKIIDWVLESRRPGGPQALQAHRRGDLDRPDHDGDPGGPRPAPGARRPA